MQCEGINYCCNNVPPENTSNSKTVNLSSLYIFCLKKKKSETQLNLEKQKITVRQTHISDPRQLELSAETQPRILGYLVYFKCI